MKKEFWIEKWQNNQTGFHKDFTHPLLIDFIDQLALKKGDTIFVPLSGKSIDMLWLHNQGFNVIGVELSELAILQFFSENNLDYVKSTDGDFDVYHYQNITIYCGDLFDLTDRHTSHVKAVYDRAALIALPEELVVRYASKMIDIIPQDSKQLLITLEFVKTAGPEGPPFSTNDAKVKKLYESLSSIKMLQKVDIIAREDKFKAQGCNYVYERVYLIQH